MITYEDFRDKRREYAFTKSVSDNPKDQDAARRIRTQMDYDDLKKQIGSKKKPTKAAVAEEDKAFNYVLSKLKAKHGDGVLTKGDKMPQPSAAQKKKNAAIRAKRAKEDGRDATEKASDGRYSDRYSNRGSD